MAVWRAEAIKRLPELRKTIESAESVMGLWIELGMEFDRAYEEKPRNESLIARIYSYADWCVAARRGPDAGRDPLTAVAVCFYEHIPARKLTREDMPRWFLRREVESARQTFMFLINKEQFESLLAHLTANASEYRGREARIRQALEELRSDKRS